MGTLSGRGPEPSDRRPPTPGPCPTDPDGPTPPARQRPLYPVPGTPADLPLARRLPLSRLPLRLQLKPRRSRAPPAGSSETHAVPAPPRRAGKTRP